MNLNIFNIKLVLTSKVDFIGFAVAETVQDIFRLKDMFQSDLEATSTISVTYHQ